MSTTYTADRITEATRRLDVAMSTLTAAFARDLEVSVPELLALENLDSEGGLGPSELARRLQLSTGAVTALVDRLEASGHAARAAHPSDRRRVVVTRTSKASADLAEEAAPVANEIHRLAEKLERRGASGGRASSWTRSSASSSGRRRRPAPHERRPALRKEHTMSSTPATVAPPDAPRPGDDPRTRAPPRQAARLERRRRPGPRPRGRRHRPPHQRLHPAGDGHLHDRTARHRA